MKIMKIIIALTISIAAGIASIACAENTVELSKYEANATQTIAVGDDIREDEAPDPEMTNPERAEVYGSTPLEEILSAPDYFARSHQSELTLVGFAANIGSQFFYIQNESGTAELMIDFRGSQAFPQEGDEIVIKGELIQNCCDPNLYMLRAMRFELVG